LNSEKGYIRALLILGAQLFVQFSGLIQSMYIARHRKILRNNLFFVNSSVVEMVLFSVLSLGLYRKHIHGLFLWILLNQGDACGFEQLLTVLLLTVNACLCIIC
jgi:hypothetical protein